MMTSKEGTRVLVTGASGFIGGHLVRILAQAGYYVMAVSGRNPLTAIVQDRAKESFICDLSDRDQVVKLINESQPEVLIHAAALSKSSLCEQEVLSAEKININATRYLAKSLADLAKAASFEFEPHFIYISSDLVFDGASAPEGGFSENELPQACSVYGRTKYAGELEVLNYHPQGLILRMCLCYDIPIGNHHGVLGWMKAGFEQGQALTLFEDEWRTPVYGADIIKVIQTGISLRTAGVFHLAGPERISRTEFGRKFAKIFGYDESLITVCKQKDYISDVPRPSDVSLSNKKAQSVFQIQFQDVSSGLNRVKQGMS